MTKSSENKKSKSVLKRPTPVPMQLTKRDEKIIVRCFEDKLLSTSFLKKLYFPSLSSCSRRLRILYSNHYLDRSFFSASPKPSGKKEAYYSLGKKGVGLVALKLGLGKKRVEKQRRSFLRQMRRHSILYTLAHIKAISKVRFSFEQAIRKNERVELISWLPERLLQQAFYNGKKRKLRPDAFLKYFIKDTQKRYTAFLEIDLATESRKQIQNKIKRYIAFSNTNLPQRSFGTSLFRVIVLTTSKERSNNIKESIETITDKIFWVTDFSKLKENFIEKPVFLRAGLEGRYPLIQG